VNSVQDLAIDFLRLVNLQWLFCFEIYAYMEDLEPLLILYVVDRRFG
jgi:hypothetical protein